MHARRKIRVLQATGLAIFFAIAIAGAAFSANASAAPDAGAPPGITSADASISKIPPDPPPMRERGQWIFDLRYDKGDLYLLGVHRVELPAPQETPRAMGRFALELFEGPTLIERVRFDFPMLGVNGPPDAGHGHVLDFQKNLTTRIGVMFPDTPRGTKLQLWDRATDRRWDLAWPQVDTRPPDGGGAEGGFDR